MKADCPSCEGAGEREIYLGWRQHGSGFGDAWPEYDIETCLECCGTGEVQIEEAPCQQS